MTLSQLAAILNAITGFKDKVVYRAWKENEAPPLPFICFYSSGSESFGADNVTYAALTNVTIELYSRRKDPASEALIEAALTANDLYFDKSETFIEAEKAVLIIYEVEV